MTATSSNPSSRPKRAASAALLRPVTPSAQLARVVGSEPMARAQVVKKVWEHIKQQGLQDSVNRRMINADARLLPIFGKPQVSMFEMTKLISQHLM